MSTSTKQQNDHSSQKAGRTINASSFGDVVDPEAPLFVASATVSTALLGAATGATMGVIRSVNPFSMSINMGINSGLAGMTFFGLREYLVSPVLLASNISPAYSRRYEELKLAAISDKARGKLPEIIDNPRSIAEVRMERLLDSGISGGLAGGALSGFIRGTRTIPRAAFTASLITTLLQLSVNQLRVFRIQLIARRSQTPIQGISGGEGGSTSTSPTSQNQIPSISTSSPTSSTSPNHHQPLTSPSSSTFNPRSSHPNPNPNTTSTPPTLRQTLSNPTSELTPEQHAHSLPGRLIAGLSTILPVRKLSDEDYLALMERKRREVDRRLGEIEKEEMRIYDWEEGRRAGRA